MPSPVILFNEYKIWFLHFSHSMNEVDYIVECNSEIPIPVGTKYEVFSYMSTPFSLSLSPSFPPWLHTPPPPLPPVQLAERVTPTLDCELLSVFAVDHTHCHAPSSPCRSGLYSSPDEERMRGIVDHYGISMTTHSYAPGNQESGCGMRGINNVVMIRWEWSPWGQRLIHSYYKIQSSVVIKTDRNPRHFLNSECPYKYCINR